MVDQSFLQDFDMVEALIVAHLVPQKQLNTPGGGVLF
jgi:hypothetical protein